MHHNHKVLNSQEVSLILVIDNSTAIKTFSTTHRSRFNNCIKMPMVGAPGEVREPDDQVHSITQQVKNEVETQAGQTFDEFVAIKCRSQLVNGTNYFIKVRVGEDKHLHLRVHRSFQGEIKLSAYQLDKTLEDDLVYFQ